MNERISRLGVLAAFIATLAFAGCSSPVAPDEPPATSTVDAGDSAAPAVVVVPIVNDESADAAGTDADDADGSEGPDGTSNGSDAAAADAPFAPFASEASADAASADGVLLEAGPETAPASSPGVPPAEGGPAALACSQGYVACGGGCVDPTSDPVNCGSCAHSCGGGACTSGACQPWAVMTTTQVTAFGCDGNDAIWADLGSTQVLEAPADGTANDHSASWSSLNPGASGTVYDIATADGVTVWTQTDPSGTGVALYEAQMPGSYGYAIASSIESPAGLALDANAAYAYFATTSGTSASIWQCNLVATSDACRVLTKVSSSEIASVAVDAENVYWTDPGNGFVSSYPLAGGSVVTVADGQRGAGPLALDAANLHWATGNGETFALNASPKASPSSTTVLASGTGNVVALASDGSRLYSLTDFGVLRSVPTAGGTLSALYVSSQTSTGALGTMVYASGVLYFGPYEDILALATP
jgi:hypothetical protein